jgi:hypothetical protein
MAKYEAAERAQNEKEAAVLREVEEQGGSKPARRAKK